MDEYSKGAKAALALFSKRAAHATPSVAAPPVSALTPHLLPTPNPLAARISTGLVGGATGGLLSATMAPSGDRMRQGAIGFASDALGGALGPWGMVASPAINMGLQAVTAPKEEEKQADHADDRMRERIKAHFPPNALADLREQAKGLDVAPGRYYLPMKDKAGNTAAIAAFKTVGAKDHLVLATVLAPKDKPPPGTSLSHLMKQPMGQRIGKVQASPKEYTIRKNTDGRLTCTCKSFKFNHQGAGTNCKHIEEHLARTKTAYEVRGPGAPIEAEEGPQTDEAALPPPEKKKSWLPAIGAGALAGLGAYKLLRTPSFSANPMLRKIQQRASDKGFHRIVPVMEHGTPVDPEAGILGKLHHAVQPKLDERGRLNAINRLKFWAQEGGEAIPMGVNSATGDEHLLNGRKPIKTEGVVFGRPLLSPTSRKFIRGGVDIEGSAKSQRALTDLGLKGKGSEANLLRRYAPDSTPESVTELSKFMQPGKRGETPAQRIARVRSIQKSMRKEFKGTGMEEFLLKPTVGFNSGGKFPMGEEDWGRHLARYDKAMRDPAFKAKFDKATGSDFADMVWDKKILQGHTLHHMLKDPSSAMAQQKIHNRLGEWRANVTRGEAPLSMMTPRGATDSPVGAMKELLTEGVDPREIKKFVESNIKRLPRHYREGTWGADVMPYRTPEGTIKYKFVELNPSETAGYHGSNGGGSGFLDASNIPWAGHAHYRTATGRHTTPVALAGGLAAAGAAGGLARYLTPEQRAEQEDEEAPHPAG